MDEHPEPSGSDEHARSPGLTTLLPPAVRNRVLTLAADAMGELTPAELPAALRPIAAFRPERRARLAAGPLAAALESDPEFRRRIATRIRMAGPDQIALLESGHVPPAADLTESAALLYLLRPEHWDALLENVIGSSEERRLDVERHRLEEVAGELRARIEQLEGDARARDAAHARQVAALEQSLDALRKELRARTGEARRAGALVAAAEEAAAARVEDAQRRIEVGRLERDRARAAAREAEEALAVARRTAREGRDADDTRLRLLLDTVLGAARGLERELALSGREFLPADAQTDPVAPAGSAASIASARGEVDDIARLEALLALPRAHLIVDGYNVTITHYGGLPLLDQRNRLVGGLGALALRTRAEVTAVFDGAEVAGPPLGRSTRNVRVLFSRPDETADALVGALARAEPDGRVVVVVSSDREVAEAAVAAGAHSVGSNSLHRLLSRA